MYIELDYRKLDDGYFCWHPRNPGVSGCWASKRDAQVCAIWTDVEARKYNYPKDGPQLFVHATRSIPLYAAARLIGRCIERGREHLILQFDYGNDLMLNDEIVKSEIFGPHVRMFTSESQYEIKLKKALSVYEKMEAKIQAKIDKEKAVGDAARNGPGSDRITRITCKKNRLTITSGYNTPGLLNDPTKAGQLGFTVDAAKIEVTRAALRAMAVLYKNTSSFGDLSTFKSNSDGKVYFSWLGGPQRTIDVTDERVEVSRDFDVKLLEQHAKIVR